MTTHVFRRWANLLRLHPDVEAGALDGNGCLQRTRSALWFPASCTYCVKKNGRAKAPLGPGDVTLKESEPHTNNVTPQ